MPIGTNTQGLNLIRKQEVDFLKGPLIRNSKVMASDVTVNSVSDLNNAPNPTKYVGPSSTPSLTASLLLPDATSTACGALTGSLFGYGHLSDLDLHVLYVYFL